MLVMIKPFCLLISLGSVPVHARARAVRSLLHMDIAAGAGDDADHHAPPHTPQIPTLGNLSYFYSKLYICLYLFIYLFIFF